MSGCNCPNLARIERTLPRGIATERYRLNCKVVGIGVNAGEMGDDLYLLSEEIRKQRCFGPSRGIPASSAGSRWQAGVALRTKSVPDQERSVSSRYCNVGGCGWWNNLLRGRLADAAEGASDHQSSH